MNLNEKFELHKILNPKIFDIETSKMHEDVREKIFEICMAFEDYCDIPLKIVDIQCVGSNCSFNYTEHSDLDVHIIANFDAVSDQHELLQAVYNSSKSSFNSNYDITIHGVEIEMYVQDVQSGITSNGIYSVCDDKWIKYPKPIEVPEVNVSLQLDKWRNKIHNAIEDHDTEQMSDIIDTLYLIRHNSLATDGEYGKGNILFKEIRNAGLMDELKLALNSGISKQLSLESLQRLNLD